MNVLIIGGGGREHALAWKISKSPLLSDLFIIKGNPGTAQFGKNINIDINDFDEISLFCIKKNIGIVIVGPEVPIVNGIWDYFDKNEDLSHIFVVAPSIDGGLLEGSKSYAKEFMKKYNIPTADYIEVKRDTISQAYDWFGDKTPPFVIKADGLAQGKGVVIAESKDYATNTINEFILQSKFGEASKKVVIEEFLDGVEFSVFVYIHNYSYSILPNAKDYKRILEGDKGLNTGGMGCISPVPFVDEKFQKTVIDSIINPTIEGLKSEKISYTGFIYFGLINCNGVPKVIEYNSRLGDPEAEVILPRIESDLLELIMYSRDNKVETYDLKISNNKASTIMLVSKGYPLDYEKGKEIVIDSNIEGSIVFHAGTKSEDGKIYTNGGRVIALTSLAPDLKTSLDIGYQNVSKIRFNSKTFRTDIGNEFLN